MSIDQNDSAITVFTAHTLEKILSEGGSGDWVLDPKRANKFKYLVCYRKPSWENRGDGTTERVPFLIGIIKSFADRSRGDERGQRRFFIELSSFAMITNGKPHHDSRRNPVAYSSLHELGVDIKGLTFKDISVAERPQVAASEQTLTISEAKRALAKTFGVKPEDVEITIRG